MSPQTENSIHEEPPAVPGVGTSVDDKALGYAIVDKLIRYLSTLEERKAYSGRKFTELLEQFGAYELPESPQTIDRLMKEIDAIMRDNMRLNSKHMGHMFTTPLALSVLVNVLIDHMNIDMSSNPPEAAKYIEKQVISWFTEMIGYKKFSEGGKEIVPGGVLTNGGSLANLNAMLMARNKAAIKAGLNPADEGMIGKHGKDFVIFASKEAHYSHKKLGGYAGIGSDNIVEVDVDDNLRMDPEDLKRKIKKAREEGRIITAIIATSVTTETGNVDPLNEIADIAEEENVWLHVDGAYGAPFRLSKKEKIRRLMSGMERADSVTFDPHKLLFIPYNSGALIVKDIKNLSLIKNSTTPEEIDETDAASSLLYPRRFDALRIWAAMKWMGFECMADLIDHAVDMREYFSGILDKDKDFEIMARPETNIFAFRFIPYRLKVKLEESVKTENLEKINEINGLINSLNKEIQANLESDGEVWLSAADMPNSRYTRYADTSSDESPSGKVRALRCIIMNPFISRVSLQECYLKIRKIAVKAAQKNPELCKMIASRRPVELEKNPGVLREKLSFREYFVNTENAGRMSAVGKQIVDITQESLPDSKQLPARPEEIFGDCRLPMEPVNIDSILDALRAIYKSSPDSGSPRPHFISSLASAVYQAMHPNLISQDSSPAATAVEVRLTKWLTEIVGYEEYVNRLPGGKSESVTPGGIITNGLGISLFTMLLIARNVRMNDFMAEHGIDITKEGMSRALCFMRNEKRKAVIIASESQAGIIKTLAGITGIGKNNVIVINEKNGNTDSESLQKALRKSEERNDVILLIDISVKNPSAANVKNLKHVLASQAQNNWINFTLSGEEMGEELCAGSKNMKELLNFDGSTERSPSPRVSCVLNIGDIFSMPHGMGVALFKDENMLKRSLKQSAVYVMREGETHIFNIGSYSVEGSKGFQSLELWLTLLFKGKPYVMVPSIREEETARRLMVETKEAWGEGGDCKRCSAFITQKLIEKGIKAHVMTNGFHWWVETERYVLDVYPEAGGKELKRLIAKQHGEKMVILKKNSKDAKEFYKGWIDQSVTGQAKKPFPPEGGGYPVPMIQDLIRAVSSLGKNEQPAEIIRIAGLAAESIERKAYLFSEFIDALAEMARTEPEHTSTCRAVLDELGNEALEGFDAVVPYANFIANLENVAIEDKTGGARGSTLRIRKDFLSHPDLDPEDRSLIEGILTADEKRLLELSEVTGGRIRIVHYEEYFKSSRNPDGETVYFTLKKPVTIKDRKVAVLRFKGVRPWAAVNGDTSDGGNFVEVRPYTDGFGFVDRPLAVEMGGNLRVIAPPARPNGTLFYKQAESEVAAMEKCRGSVVETDLAIGIGKYSDFKFNGEDTGYLIAGMENNDVRITTTKGRLFPVQYDAFEFIPGFILESGFLDLNEKKEEVLKELGRTLRAYNDMGYCHNYAHLGNIGLRKVGEKYGVVLRDLCTTTPITAKHSLRARAAFRFLDIAMVLRDLPRTRENISSFLTGYFHETLPLGENFTKMLEECMNDTKFDEGLRTLQFDVDFMELSEENLYFSSLMCGLYMLEKSLEQPATPGVGRGVAIEEEVGIAPEGPIGAFPTAFLEKLRRKPYIFWENLASYDESEFRRFEEFITGRKVLDVGTGVGWTAICASLYGALHVTAVDPNRKSIDLARDMARQGDYKNVDFLVANAESLPFAEGEFDIVTITYVFRFLPASIRQKVLGECRRVLKPGGRILIIDFLDGLYKYDNGNYVKVAENRTWNEDYWTDERFKDELAKAGFGDVDIGMLGEGRTFFTKIIKRSITAKKIELPILGNADTDNISLKHLLARNPLHRVFKDELVGPEAAMQEAEAFESRRPFGLKFYISPEGPKGERPELDNVNPQSGESERIRRSDEPTEREIEITISLASKTGMRELVEKFESGTFGITEWFFFIDIFITRLKTDYENISLRCNAVAERLEEIRERFWNGAVSSGDMELADKIRYMDKIIMDIVVGKVVSEVEHVELLDKSQAAIESNSSVEGDEPPTAAVPGSKVVPDLERERKIAVDFRDTLIDMALTAKENGQYIILGLDESWIPNKGSIQPVINAIGRLLEKLRRRGLDNIIFERGEGDEVAVEIQKEQKKTKTSFTNIIVLGSQSILKSDEFNKLKGEKPEDRALLIGVNAKNLNLTTDTGLPEMYLLAMRLNSGKRPSELDQAYIKITPDPSGRPRAFVFEPIKPFDIEYSNEVNRIRIQVIGSKA
ncbi:MAG: aminotransferase class I/II-fold pyridoxal phosphate-dependent enzyme [Candidatus Omnitrophica bacterium]|nr:aminotransferase class I/II-fold pyridoxal phosphate-dependent enzyme [Candidatus Omnitrophota bacterium]